MELNGDQTRTGTPNIDMEGETKSGKAHGEQNKTQDRNTSLKILLYYISFFIFILKICIVFVNLFYANV